ncbi:MAG: hypothetical protein IKE30_09535 [Clostridia bacterium]|nr:hypothetical protein [Clostridia bacterium]
MTGAERGAGGAGELCGSALRQYRTNEVVDRQVDFASGVPADFDGLLEVNREICRKWMVQKTLPGVPANCAVLP